MLMGIYSQSGKGNLVVSDGTANGPTNRAIVRKSLLPNWRRFEHQGVYFQQDNASSHTAELTQDVFDNYGIDFIEWLANSPDSSPIENIWS